MMKTGMFAAGGERRDIRLALHELGAGIGSVNEPISSVVYGLRPSFLDHVGLMAAHDWYVDEFAARGRMNGVVPSRVEDPDLPRDTAAVPDQRRPS